MVVDFLDVLVEGMLFIIDMVIEFEEILSEIDNVKVERFIVVDNVIVDIIVIFIMIVLLEIIDFENEIDEEVKMNDVIKIFEEDK